MDITTNDVLCILRKKFNDKQKTDSYEKQPTSFLKVSELI